MWNLKETVNNNLEVSRFCGKLFTGTILQSHKRNHTVFQNKTRRERGLKNLFGVKILLNTGLYSKNAQQSSLSYFWLSPYNPHKLDWLSSKSYLVQKWYQL